MRLLLTLLLAFASAPLLAAGCDECLESTGCPAQLKACVAKCNKTDTACNEQCDVKNQECSAQNHAKCSLQCEQVIASANPAKPIWAQPQD
jgi:hypothetical protein